MLRHYKAEMQFYKKMWNEKIFANLPRVKKFNFYYLIF